MTNEMDRHSQLIFPPELPARGLSMVSQAFVSSKYQIIMQMGRLGACSRYKCRIRQPLVSSAA